jgi:hypothetical protein
MKNYLVLFICVTFSSLHSIAQMDSSRCAGFRTGTFAYRDDSSNAVLITRTNNLQVERIKKTGEVTRFKITWLGQCSYELKQVWSNRKKKRKNNGATTLVLITNAGKDQYEFSCACKITESSSKTRGTVYRVQ